jgi:hypothetical protein
MTVGLSAALTPVKTVPANMSRQAPFDGDFVIESGSESSFSGGSQLCVGQDCCDELGSFFDQRTETCYEHKILSDQDISDRAITEITDHYKDNPGFDFGSTRAEAPVFVSGRTKGFGHDFYVVAVRNVSGDLVALVRFASITLKNSTKTVAYRQISLVSITPQVAAYTPQSPDYTAISGMSKYSGKYPFLDTDTARRIVATLPQASFSGVSVERVGLVASPNSHFGTPSEDIFHEYVVKNGSASEKCWVRDSDRALFSEQQIIQVVAKNQLGEVLSFARPQIDTMPDDAYVQEIDRTFSVLGVEAVSRLVSLYAEAQQKFQLDEASLKQGSVDDQVLAERKSQMMSYYKQEVSKLLQPAQVVVLFGNQE